MPNDTDQSVFENLDEQPAAPKAKAAPPPPPPAAAKTDPDPMPSFDDDQDLGGFSGRSGDTMQVRVPSNRRWRIFKIAIGAIVLSAAVLGLVLYLANRPSAEPKSIAATAPVTTPAKAAPVVTAPAPEAAPKAPDVIIDVEPAAPDVTADVPTVGDARTAQQFNPWVSSKLVPNFNEMVKVQRRHTDEIASLKAEIASLRDAKGGNAQGSTAAVVLTVLAVNLALALSAAGLYWLWKRRRTKREIVSD
jgi:hypothetical protein